MSQYSNHIFDRTFILSPKHKRLTIWKAYHNENQLIQYYMLNDEKRNIFLFNTTNLGYSGKNINHLNRLLCETVCLLYPYFNNLKSDIIGFQHYRRIYNINKLKTKDIFEGKIQTFATRNIKSEATNEYKLQYGEYSHIFSHFYFWRQYACGFMDDYFEFLVKYFPEYLMKYDPNKCPPMHGFFSFASSWNKYIKLCDFIWGYLNFIADKYHFNVYSEDDWVEFVKEHFIEYNQKNKIPPIKTPWNDNYGENNWKCNGYDNNIYDMRTFSYYRAFSFNTEYMVSVFCNCEGYVYDSDNCMKFLELN